jgi:hypothetical protein
MIPGRYYKEKQKRKERFKNRGLALFRKNRTP